MASVGGLRVRGFSIEMSSATGGASSMTTGFFCFSTTGIYILNRYFSKSSTDFYIRIKYMDYLLKKKREKIEEEAERLYGNDTLLKAAFVMSKMESTKEEIEEATKYMRQESADLAAEIESKMLYKYDMSGNLVPVNPEIEDNVEINISN
jgi:hypothetical protein